MTALTSLELPGLGATRLTWPLPPAGSADLVAPGAVGSKPWTGHRSVMVLPGFLACDWSTLVLRGYLRLLGHGALPWGFGRNLGPVNHLLARLIARVERLASEDGNRVSLVGHSLGGIYAREIARAVPDAVGLVVTLGSPFRCADGSGANPSVLRLLELTMGCGVGEMADSEGFTRIAAPLPRRVPSVAIYSKEDYVANWRCCISEPAVNTENIEVPGSHAGMLVNPIVFGAVADRLARHSAAL